MAFTSDEALRVLADRVEQGRTAHIEQDVAG
jgi:hypothetical protein